MRYWLSILEMNIFFSLGSSYYSKRSLSKDVILGHICYSRELVFRGSDNREVFLNFYIPQKKETVADDNLFFCFSLDSVIYLSKAR